MSHPVLERRRAEQQDRIRMASAWARGVGDSTDVVAAVVFGSTARGDFNKWSDIDVLLIAQKLPADARERLAWLMTDAPPGLQPVGWTPAEWATRCRRRDPIALECMKIGIPVLGSLPT